MNDFRILVVDDKPAQLELLSGFLNKQGFETVLAESATKAIEIFRQGLIDLVITDQKMPDMSGLDLLKSVRLINPEAAVVVITAYGTVDTAVAAIKSGAADYLSKPVNLDELLYRIEQVRERHRLVSENRELRETLIGRPEHVCRVLRTTHTGECARPISSAASSKVIS